MLKAVNTVAQAIALAEAAWLAGLTREEAYIASSSRTYHMIVDQAFGKRESAWLIARTRHYSQTGEML